MRVKCLILASDVALSSAQAPADEAGSPKPGPEHEKMKSFVGDWDAVVKFGTQEMRGTASYRLGMGGFWLTEEFKSESPENFEGRGTMGYDPIKKKYVSTWIDSESPSMMVMEGEFDKDGKTYTETGEGPGPDGKPQKMKSALEFKDKDTIHFTMYTVADGKDQETLNISYKRKQK